MDGCIGEGEPKFPFSLQLFRDPIEDLFTGIQEDDKVRQFEIFFLFPIGKPL